MTAHDLPGPPRPFPNTYWVIPGRLLAGEHPAAAGAAEARPRVQRLVRAGIECYIDLTEEGEVPDYRRALPRRAAYLRSPIADSSVPFNVSQTESVLAALRDALLEERGVYVHCRAGIGRTGLIVGCYLAEEEGNGRRALARLNRLWRQSDRSRSWPRIPQTAEQADYITRWPKLRGLHARRAP